MPKLDSIAKNTIMQSGLSLMAVSSVKIGSNEWWERSKEVGWRFGASPQRYALDAIEQNEAFLERFAKLEDLPYDKAKAAADNQGRDEGLFIEFLCERWRRSYTDILSAADTPIDGKRAAMTIAVLAKVFILSPPGTGLILLRVTYSPTTLIYRR